MTVAYDPCARHKIIVEILQRLQVKIGNFQKSASSNENHFHRQLKGEEQAEIRRLDFLC